MYVFDPTGWWNRASQDLISQETSKKMRMMYLIKSLFKASMVIEVGFFLLIVRLLYFSSGCESWVVFLTFEAGHRTGDLQNIRAFWVKYESHPAA
jgi:hypothetical protein